MEDNTTGVARSKPTSSLDFLFSRTVAPVYVCSLANERGKEAEQHVQTRNPAVVSKFAAKWDQAGRGLFFCVSTITRSKRTKENAVESAFLHADVDLKDIDLDLDQATAALMRLEIPPSRIHRTGNGLHAYWLLDRPCTDGPRVEAALKKLCGVVGGDSLVTHRAALMRLPGSHNTKGGKWTEVVVAHDSGAQHTMEELEEWLDRQAPVIAHKDEPADDNVFLRAAANQQYKPPIDAGAMLAAMKEGNVHDTQLRVAASLLNSGMTIDDVVKKVLEATMRAAAAAGVTEQWNWAQEERAIRGMCEDWIEKHPEVAEQIVAVNTFAEFQFIGYGSVEPEPTLIDGLLSLKNITVIAGQSSAGKTFVAISMMVCLALGRPFFGRAVNERVGSLYVAGEGQGSINARFAAALDGVSEQPDCKPPIAWMAEPPQLDTPQRIDAFAGKLRDLDAKFKRDHGVRLGVVVLDTVSACFDIKDESDNAEITRVCKLMKRLSAAFGGVVVPVHHYGKSIEAGVRGASAWRGNSEIILAVLAELDSLTGEASSRMLAASKVRDGVQGPIAPFALQSVVVGRTVNGAELFSCFVQEQLGVPFVLPTVRVGRPNQSLLDFVAAADEALSTHGEKRVVQPGEAPVRAVPLSKVREGFNRRYAVGEEDEAKTAQAKRMAFKRGLDKARGEFTTGEIDGGDWLWRT